MALSLTVLPVAECRSHMPGWRTVILVSENMQIGRQQQTIQREEPVRTFGNNLDEIVDRELIAAGVNVRAGFDVVLDGAADESTIVTAEMNHREDSLAFDWEGVGKRAIVLLRGRDGHHRERSKSRVSAMKYNNQPGHT